MSDSLSSLLERLVTLKIVNNPFKAKLVLVVEYLSRFNFWSSGERWAVQCVQHADHRRPVVDEGLEGRPVCDRWKPDDLLYIWFPCWSSQINEKSNVAMCKVCDGPDRGEPHQQPQLHLQGECPLQRPPPQVCLHNMLNLWVQQSGWLIHLVLPIM